MATFYKKLLVAVDFEPKSQQFLLERVKQLKQLFNPEIYLLHAVEYVIYADPYGLAPQVELEESLFKQATTALQAASQDLGLPDSHILIKKGFAKNLILEEAENLKVDLIVVGSHAQSTIRWVLGSTTNAVLHRAKCDVLTVRVPSPE